MPRLRSKNLSTRGISAFVIFLRRFIISSRPRSKQVAKGALLSVHDLLSNSGPLNPVQVQTWSFALEKTIDLELDLV